MGTTKHPRKSGATTIKKDGKIVGNIGQGKKHIPTAKTSHFTPITDIQTCVTIGDAQKRFKIVEDKTCIDFEQCCTLWELTSSQPMSDRLNLCENYFTNMKDEDQNSFIAHIEQEALADPDIDLWRKQPVKVVAIGHVLKGTYGNISETVLRKFIFNPELTIDWRKNILLNDSLSNQMLTDISEHNTNPKIAAAIVEHKNSTPKLIQSIYDKEREGKGKSFKVVGTQARSHQDRILSAIAKSHKTPKSILLELASSDVDAYRAYVSTNPITPKQILTILSKDENSVIRANVTGHRRTPPEVITKLVSEGEGHLKSLAAGNPSTPMETLKNLAKIQDGKVGHIARKTIAKLKS